MRKKKSIPLLLVFLSMYEEIHEWLARTLSLPLTAWFSGSSIWHMTTLHLPDLLSSDARNCRSAYRNDNDPGNRNRNIGFRFAAAHPHVDSAADPALVMRDYSRMENALPGVSRRVDARSKAPGVHFFSE